MMNNNGKVQDERVISQTQKALANAGSIMLILLFCSTFIKMKFMDMEFKYFASELIIMAIGGIYIIIQAVIDGNLDLGFSGKNAKLNKARAIAYSIIGGLVFGISQGLLNYFKYDFAASMLPSIIIPMIIEFTILSFGACWLVDFVSRKRNLRIAKQFDLDDNKR